MVNDLIELCLLWLEAGMEKQIKMMTLLKRVAPELMLRRAV